MWITILFGIVFSLEDLPKLNANIKETTVSGESSGAFMAVQMHFAYSEFIKGCGAFAGGPYACALGDLIRGFHPCSDGPLDIDVPTLVNVTDSLVDQELISNTTNLNGANVYLFSGTNDKTVLPEAVKDSQKLYEHYSANITTKYDLDAGHCIPTVDYGVTCSESHTPWINKCNYAGVESALMWIFGSLKPGVPAILTNLIEFDQTKYQPGGSFQTYGYAYVPSACRNGASCRLHVAFHGCHQGSWNLGTDWVLHTGYNELAEANNLVILYPQVQASIENPINASGCWDFWGYNDELNDSMIYATQLGMQIKAVWDMVEHMTSQDSTCDVYTCSDGSHSIPENTCWMKSSESTHDHYYVTPCGETKPVCPLPPLSTEQGLCEAIPNLPNQTALPGEKCDGIDYVCFGGQVCKNGICQGIAEGQVCPMTLLCNPGLYCTGNPPACTPQLSSGQQCTSDYDCQNNNFCYNSKCQLYASLGFEESWQMDEHCSSFYCDQTEKKCYLPPESAQKSPVKCTNSDAECSSVSFVTSKGTQTTTSTCACGYNPNGDKYCALNPGDLEYRLHSNIMKEWLTGTQILKCNTERRKSDRCLQTYMNADTYEARRYFEESVNYLYRYVGVESCVQQALFESYYQEKDDLFDIDDDYATLFIGIYLLNLL